MLLERDHLLHETGLGDPDHCHVLPYYGLLLRDDGLVLPEICQQHDDLIQVLPDQGCHHLEHGQLFPCQCQMVLEDGSVLLEECQLLCEKDQRLPERALANSSLA